VTFWQLALNSLLLAVSTSFFSVLIGVFAAYVFSRLKFRGREVLMIAVLAVLMLPAVATIAPLFVMMNRIQVFGFNLRQSLLGVGLAVISGLLPFAIWNLKGYLDTIPKDLEEAAAVDGATRNQAFLRVILPLAMPALAVTGFLGVAWAWRQAKANERTARAEAKKSEQVAKFLTDMLQGVSPEDRRSRLVNWFSSRMKGSRWTCFASYPREICAEMPMRRSA